MEQHYSRVYTDRPAYADLDSPEKFQAIQGIIMTRLRQHPKAICSYSGGADSDIMIEEMDRIICGYQNDESNFRAVRAELRDKAGVEINWTEDARP
jgi:hypothetical protein